MCTPSSISTSERDRRRTLSRLPPRVGVGPASSLDPPHRPRDEGLASPMGMVATTMVQHVAPRRTACLFLVLRRFPVARPCLLFSSPVLWLILPRCEPVSGVSMVHRGDRVSLTLGNFAEVLRRAHRQTPSFTQIGLDRYSLDGFSLAHFSLLSLQYAVSPLPAFRLSEPFGFAVSPSSSSSCLLLFLSSFLFFSDSELG